tara:strand:+ start:203 stop:379 length:177 start_codon:yes stop_codon:yes gene_type:complete
MPTLQNWEDYLEMEEELDIQDTREKVLQKKNKSNKPNKKGHQENVKRDKKNSWNNRSN